ncbi:hypothetical protein WA158_004575 [Blastocystis sp. Blastoise]
MAVSKKHFMFMLIASFCSMITQGLLDNVKSVTLPLLQTEFQASDDQYGILASMVNLGYVLFAFASSYVVRPWGFKATMIVAMTGGALSCIMMAYVPSFSWAIVFQLIGGIGLGATDLPPDILGTLIFGNKMAFYMTLLNAFYGVGGLFSPFLATYSVNWYPYGYKSIYLYTMVPIILMIIYVMCVPFAVNNMDSVDKESEDIEKKQSHRNSSINSLDHRSSIDSIDTKKKISDSDIHNDQTVVGEDSDSASSPVSIGNPTITQQEILSSNPSDNAIIHITDNTIVHDSNIIKNSQLEEDNVLYMPRCLSPSIDETSIKNDINTNSNPSSRKQSIQSYTSQTQTIIHESWFRKLKKHPMVDALCTPTMYLFSITLTMTTMVERANINWSTIYIDKVLGLDPVQVGGLFNSLFFMLYTIVRFFGGYITDKLGNLPTMYGCLIITILMLLIGYFTEVVGLWIICASSIFICLFWPTMICLANEYFEEKGPTIVSVMLPFQSVLSAVFQPFLGWMNGEFGPASAFRFTIVFGILALLLLIWDTLLIVKKRKLSKIIAI